MERDIRSLAILAGRGRFPREVAERARAAGASVHIIAIDGEADDDFAAFPVTRVNWGGFGAMIAAIKQGGNRTLVIVGGVKRPDIWALRPDFGFFRSLGQIAKIVTSGGDDSVLRKVVRFFEQHGIVVIGPGDAAPDLVIAAGRVGSLDIVDGALGDAAKGFEIVRALGPFDIGQGVVVADGVVEAIEGVEGTDRMIERVAMRRAEWGRGAERAGVFVKRSKPGQDLRVDMPAIGPQTVTGAAKAGLSGLAVEANRVLVVDRADVLRLADESGLFVAGVPDDAAGAVPQRFKARGSADRFKRLSAVRPRPNALADAEKGLAVSATLEPFGAGRSIVVMRNHVLSVDAGEGAHAVVARAMTLRQWGSITRRRRGMAIFADVRDLDDDLIRAIDRAGFAGAAFRRFNFETVAARRALELADRLGLVMLEAQ